MKKVLPVLLSSFLLVSCGTADKNTTSSTSTPASESTSASENNAGAINLDAHTPDMSAYVFLQDKDAAFLEISSEESLKLFVNGTGLVIYSYETCPWCNRVIPILDEVAKEEGKKVFYVNIYSQSFLSQSDEKKSEVIQSLYSVLDPILDRETDEETGEEKPVMQVPEVVAVKDGKIMSHHLGIVDGFTLDQDHLNEYQVTDSQKEELKNIYRDMFKSIE